MKKLYSSNAIRCAEKNTMDKYAYPSLMMIERAAVFAYESICNSYDMKPMKALVLCGTGNNGADGLALARMLIEHGISAKVFLQGDRSKATDENKQELEWLLCWDSNVIIDELEDNYNLYVDAILGIGVNRPLSDKYFDLVKRINSYSSDVIALDIPTGIDSDSGVVCGIAVKADATIVFGGLKKGLFIGDGKEYAGKIVYDSVGIDTASVADEAILAFEEEDFDYNLYKRKLTGNKGTFGKLLIIAGCDSMPGAGIMCARAAFAVGAGMVKLISDSRNKEAYLSVVPELMVDSYNEMSMETLISNFDWCDTVLIGPGLSLNEKAEQLVCFTVQNCKKTLIIDADGLNILSKHMDLLKTRACRTIVTPHPMEFSRMFDTSVSSKMHADVEYLKAKAKEFNITIVAKDATTLITSGERIYANIVGSDALAKAGSGDTLAGILGGLAHNYEAMDIMAAEGCYIHGVAAMNNDKGSYSLTNASLLRAISELILQE